MITYRTAHYFPFGDLCPCSIYTLRVICKFLRAGLIPQLQPNLTQAKLSSVDRRLPFLQHIYIIMVQMKVTASVLLAAAAIAPVVANGFEAENSLFRCVVSLLQCFLLLIRISNVVVRTTNLKVPLPETSISRCKSQIFLVPMSTFH